MSSPDSTVFLSASDCYHFGLVVPDIDSAATRLTRIAGYQWTRPIEAEMTVRTPGGDTDVEVRFVYSLQAPHLELITAIPGTPWTASPVSASHHLAFWVDDMAAAARCLEGAGYALEMQPTGDLASTFAYYIDSAGVRIEIVARKYFPDWPGFLKAMTR